MLVSKTVSRRKFLQLGAAASAGLMAGIYNSRFALAQGDPTATPGQLPPPPPAGPVDLQSAGGLEKLIEMARAEGELSTIALPDDWANYGAMKKVFLEKYNFIKHNDLAPEASSGEEIEAIKANAGNKGPQNPDVIDVGFIWGASAKEQGLLQPYKVATWDSIPDAVKDADGYWYGNYYGTLAFEVNADVVKNIPQDWSDLLKPEYKGQVTISGDPTSSSQAIHSVWAAAIGNGASLDDPTPGLEFFKQLAESGNLIATPFSIAAMDKGETPISLRWDYNALSHRDASKDIAKIEVVYPKSGSIAGVYLNGINAYAPRPHAARLWQEFIYSDEGQLIFLSGYATPIRFEDMKKRRVIPADLMAKLPVSDIKVAFPSVADISKALARIQSGWPEIVGFKLATQ
jgi:putative spermidine/putrescine transport system substrate-binding protein